MSKLKIILFASFIILLPGMIFSATGNTSGRILLQVESKGEAWYVNPVTKLRYFLGRPYDAFKIMREQGIGVSNVNIAKIPIGQIASRSDRLAVEYGNKSQYDLALAKKFSGRILLQVESKGEAWYIYPVDLKRYYLGRALDAFTVMRALGLGITNANLSKIPSDNPNYQVSTLEKKIFDLVNLKRTENGVAVLKWNDDLAKVAREHSQDLADENRAFTGIGVSCNFPLIHHEGLEFGLYNNNRLNSRNIYYFNKSGENIALMPGVKLRYTYTQGDPIINEIKTCEAERIEWDSNFDTEIHKDYSATKKIEIIQADIKKRTDAYKLGHELDIVKLQWETEEQLALDTVQGWFESAGHKKNMLDADFDEAGMGAAYINGYLITTQSFIRRTDCGFKTGPCCEKEGYYPYCYEPLTCSNKICL